MITMLKCRDSRLVKAIISELREIGWEQNICVGKIATKGSDPLSIVD
jgi:hypothetical protein